MSLKITQIMLARGFGGAERHFVDLSLELADGGHTIQAICHRAFEQRAVLEAHPNISVIGARVWGAWDRLAKSATWRAIDRFGPQVVHAHLARGAHFASFGAAGRLIPVVANTHNYVDLKYYRGVSHFMTATEDQRRHLMDHGIAGERVDVIPHFSRLAPVDTARSTLSPAPVFVAYGRLVHKKGFDVLLEAFARYVARGGRGSLVIGGSGPEQTKLEALRQHLGLAGRVRFAGWVDNVRGLLDSGDVFVLPSRDEPFGIVVLEAMARGLPMICTRAQGPREILADATARLVEIGDPEALAEALVECERAAEACVERAHRALERFKSHYSAAAVIPRILECYGAAIRDARGSPAGSASAP